MLLKQSNIFQFADGLQLEVKADKSGRISGYGSIFGNIDGYNERVLHGAFAKSLAEHKSRASGSKCCGNIARTCR